MKPVAVGFNDVLSTPVVNLVRGRIGPCPRLTYQQVLAASGLPTTTATTILRVVRRTRLRAREKAEVAGELVAHFQDGLEAGRVENELLASFGDVKQAARLIRRAKLRNRPAVWKAARAVKRAAQLVFALVVVVYAVQALRFYRHPISVARDYVAEWNAPALAIPETERAWRVYRAAILLRQPKVPNYDDADLNPDSPRSGELAAYIADNQPAVELCRQAAAMPKLGAVCAPAPDEELERSLRFPEPTSRPAGDTYSLAVMPHYAVLREASRLLELDTYMAVRDGDAARSAADIDAISGVSDHAFQLRTFMGELVGLAIANVTCRIVKSALHEHSGVFPDDQLIRLSHRLSALAGGPDVHLSLASEYVQLDDFLQRYYTDDGNGDGLAAVFFMMGESGPVAVRPGKYVTPALAIAAPSRRSTREHVRQLLARSEAEARVPLWNRGPSEVEAEVKQYPSSSLSGMYYATFAGLFQSYSRVFLLCDYFMQNRDATLVAVALELYQRHTGHYPAALEELTPQYLPQVPPDRYDGRPIKYRLVEGQPVLYSIGVDRVDDGGRLPAPKPGERFGNHRAREWEPPGTADVARGDWLLWPPVESGAPPPGVSSSMPDAAPSRQTDRSS